MSAYGQSGAPAIVADQSPLRIGCLIFGSLTSVGGYQIFTYELLSTLAMRGHRVDLYVPHDDRSRNRDFYNSMPFSVKALLFQTKRLFRRAPFVLRSYLGLQDLVNRYDVWQIIGAYPAGYVASSLSGRVPLVLRTHGDDIQRDRGLNYGSRLDPKLDGIIKETLQKMDRVVALTDSVTECYRELDVPENKIVQIPNGIDVGRYQHRLDCRATREKWGIPSGRPFVLTVGRNHPKKGFASIPRIASILKARGARFFWLVVGKGTDELDPALEQYQVADLVKTAGEIGPSGSHGLGDGLRLPSDELVRLFQCADIVAVPSLLETFGRVIVEAMASMAAVVTTDAPGCRDVVTHEKTGLAATAGDAEDFASHLYRLIEDPGMRDCLIDNASHYVQRYDWDVVAGSYVRLYRSLLG